MTLTTFLVVTTLRRPFASLFKAWIDVSLHF